jgi:prepilin peptidase CpaA
LLVPPMTLTMLPLAFPAMMVFAASYDGLSMQIGNRLCLLLALTFFPAAVLTGLSTEAILLHASCALAMLAAGFAVFALGWAGGGDAKLFAAAALWFGWEHVGAFAALTAISGGGLALGFVAWRVLRARFWPRLGAAPATHMPYGIALACGALLTYPHSLWAGGL